MQWVAAESLDAALRYMRQRFEDFTIAEAHLVGMIPLGHVRVLAAKTLRMEQLRWQWRKWYISTHDTSLTR
jgi:hypothetical protein